MGFIRRTAWKALRNPGLATKYLLAKRKRYTMAGRLALFSRFPVGQHIYDRPWDALIILDTCRVDALREVAPEFGFYDADDVKSIVSLGSETPEWLVQTFTPDWRDEIASTAYITGNAWTHAVLSEGQTPEDYHGISFAPTRWNPVRDDDFRQVVHAWQKQSSKPYELEGIAAPHPDPEIVTDHAIEMARTRDPERLIVHYKQPHAPYDSNAIAENRADLERFERRPFAFLKDGGDRATVWNAYLDDLRFVLAEVQELLRNIDAPRTIITADHGEAFGEYYGYAHRSGMLNPYVKRVPWVETSAQDDALRDPELDKYSISDRDVTAHLKALGYA